MSKFVVAHNGARRGYAVPSILERAGMLECFFTDACGNAGWARWLRMGRYLPWIGPKFAKLAARRVPDNVVPKTVTKLWPNMRWLWRSLWASSDASERFALEMRRQLELGNAAASGGFGNATHLYSMFGEFSTLLIAAKESGLKVVTEIYILFSTDLLVADERAKFPEWEEVPPDWDGIKKRYLNENVLFSRTDYYVCPSEAVRDDLVSHWDVDPGNAVVVPYGMDPKWLRIDPLPVQGRVLFVGTADLRKGIHYLAKAAEILKARGRCYEFRIAGHVTDQVRSQPVCRHLTFLGRVPRDRIHEEFQQADVFTLPSLAEGSAEVTYEALAAGLPLIVTNAAGSVVRHGIEGMIVPERDPFALADAIESVVENRSQRDQFGAAARLRATDYTWDRYGERLLVALKSFAA